MAVWRYLLGEGEGVGELQEKHHGAWSGVVWSGVEWSYRG